MRWKAFSDGASNVNPRREWREICEEVLRETSTERVNDLLEELLDALETRFRNLR